MNALNCDMQSYSGPNWSTSLFDTQRPKWRSIDILVENEITEQINNATAQQVSERNRF